MSTIDATENSGNRQLRPIGQVGALLQEVAEIVLQIPNPHGYTGEQYAADLVSVLPGAIYDLHRCGFLNVCAHCGGPQTGDGTAIHTYPAQGKCTDVRVVAICNTCLSGPISPPANWSHVGDESCLYYDEEYWWDVVQKLRLLPALSGRYGPCVVLGGW